MPTADGKMTWEEQQYANKSPAEKARWDEYKRDPLSIAGVKYGQEQGGLQGDAWRGSMPNVLTDWAQSVFDPAAAGLSKGRHAAYNYNMPQEGLRAFSNEMKPGLLAGAQRVGGGNPYNTGIANQSRQAQMALMNQMRAQQAGPSLAALQGQRAMGQMGQQAIGSAAMGGSGRAAMLGAGQMGAGMAGDVAQGRLAEIIRSQAAIGGMAGGMRGNALNSAQQQQQTGLSAQNLADQNSRFNATQGMSLAEAKRQADLEAYKFYRRAILDKTKESQKTQADTGQAAATVLDIFI